MSRSSVVLLVAFMAASVLGGCLGAGPAADRGGTHDSPGPGSEPSGSDVAVTRFYDNWTEQQRMILDERVIFPVVGGGMYSGNAVNVTYLPDATPLRVSLRVTWEARHDLERELVLENFSRDYAYVGLSPLKGSFAPEPWDGGYEWFYIWMGGDTVGFTHDLTIDIDVSVLYEASADS